MLFSIHAKNSENRQTEILLQQTAAHNGALLSVLHKKLKCLSFVRKKNIFVIVGQIESSWKCIPKVQQKTFFSSSDFRHLDHHRAGKKKEGSLQCFATIDLINPVQSHSNQTFSYFQSTWIIYLIHFSVTQQQRQRNNSSK